MRLRSSLVLVVILLTLGVGAGSAVAKGGARLSFVAARFKPSFIHEVGSIDAAGHEPMVLAGGPPPDLPSDVPIPQLDSRPSWSAEGTRFSFLAVSTGDFEYHYYVADADGGHAKQVPSPKKIYIESDPILAPDGDSIVFLAQKAGRLRPLKPVKSAIASLPVDGGKLNLMTPWTTDETFAPSSFSPDGKSLAATRYQSKTNRRDAVTMELAHGRVTLLARNAVEPSYGPDGSVVAVRDHPLPLTKSGNPIRSSDLLDISGLGAKTERVLRSGGSIAWPTVDPSGSRIAYTEMKGRAVGEGAFLEDNSLMEVNVDGSCLTRVAAITTGGSFAGSTWQPGAARGAGPISC